MVYFSIFEAYNSAHCALYMPLEQRLKFTQWIQTRLHERVVSANASLLALFYINRLAKRNSGAIMSYHCEYNLLVIAVMLANQCKYSLLFTDYELGLTEYSPRRYTLPYKFLGGDGSPDRAANQCKT